MPDFAAGLHHEGPKPLAACTAPLTEIMLFALGPQKTRHVRTRSRAVPYKASSLPEERNLFPPFVFQIGVFGGEQQLEHPFVPVKKIFGDLVVFGFGVLHLGNAGFGKQVDEGVRVGEEDG